VSEGGNWLQRYLEEAVQRKLCTQIHCTTCGASEFREGYREQLRRATGLEHGPMFGGASALAHALAGVTPGKAAAPELDRAVRLILFEAWPFLGAEGGESELAVILRGSWAGSVLARMQAHTDARKAARTARAKFEAGAPKRKEEKNRLKQERFAVRLAGKEERDRKWRERNRGGEK
jgi:hypothetical protein